MRRDLNVAQLQQHFRFARGIGRNLQIFSERVLGFIELLLSRSRVAQIKPEIRFDRRIVDLAQHAEVFLGRAVIFLVVIIRPERFQDFGGNPRIFVLGKQGIDFFCHCRAVVQAKVLTGDD